MPLLSYHNTRLRPLHSIAKHLSSLILSLSPSALEAAEGSGHQVAPLAQIFWLESAPPTKVVFCDLKNHLDLSFPTPLWGVKIL